MGLAKQSSQPAGRRGRPPKYGRPAQSITLTLPDDVIDWLRGVHPDPAWAVVKLHDRYRDRTKQRAAKPDAELVQLPGRRALIVVRPDLFRGLHGVSLIPLQDGRAFLALAGSGGLAELEVALLDKAEKAEASYTERQQLRAIRSQIKSWRQSGIKFETRSIIVALLSPAEGRQPGPLGELRTGREHGAA